MKVLLVEPFFTGSHKEWALNLKEHSSHEFYLLTLEGRNWKWRMRGGAVSLSKLYKGSGFRPDIVLVSDMLDLPAFLALSGLGKENVPVVLYFHENQYLYPIPQENRVYRSQQDFFGSVNLLSALAADRTIFNSWFHKEEAFNAFRNRMERAPDHRETEAVTEVERHSTVFPPGLDLEKLDISFELPEKKRPAILWNHRWEFDKSPKDFLNLIKRCYDAGMDFDLILLGEGNEKDPIYRELVDKYPERILAKGFQPTKEEYYRWLWYADILPVVSQQDFFGISVVEAIYCKTVPLLPDRLAYPEHLPDGKEKLLYRDQEELFQKCLQFLDEIPEAYQAELREAVAEYDIRHWIRDMDAYLEASSK